MSEVKLLPLPEWYEACGPSVKRDMRNYARANMEPLIAENEALRAKYQRAAESSEHFAARAERLAEALQELVEVFSESGMYDEEVFAKARAALDQEGGNE